MKNRKKLMLNESATRRFMKLANISALSEGFFDKVTEADEEEEELGPEEDPMGEPGADEPELPMDEPGADIPMGEPEDVPLGEPEGEEGDEMVSKLDRVVDALEDLLKGTGELGPEDSLTLSVGGGEEGMDDLGGEEMPPEEDPMEEPPMEEPELEENKVEEGDELEEATGPYKRDEKMEESEKVEEEKVEEEKVEETDAAKIDEDTINEVTRRVAMRIIQAMKKDK